MGIFDSIFGTKQKSSGKTVNDTNVQKSSKDATVAGSSTQTGTVSAGTTTTGQTQQQQLQTLDPQVQQQLIDVIGALSGEDAGAGASIEQAQELVNFLSTRAQQGDQQIAADTAAIINAARQRGENELEAVGTRNAAQAGSSFNTLAQAATQRGRNEFEVSLAGAAGELGLQGRQMVTGEAAAALDAAVKTGNLSAGAGLEQFRVLADIAGTLKGANQTGTVSGTTETATTAEQQQTTQRADAIMRLIEELTQGKTTQVSDASGTTTKSPFDALLGLLSI